MFVCSYFWSKKFCILPPDTKQNIMIQCPAPIIFLSLSFLVFRNTLVAPSWFQAIGIKSSSIFAFWVFLRTTQQVHHYHHNNHSNHAMILLLVCHKPVRDKLQRERVFPHCNITHLPGFKIIKDIIQGAWFRGRCLVAYHFALKRSGIQWNTSGMVRIILLHISWDLKWSRTYLNMRGLWSIASAHISCVHQPGRIILLHISLIFLRWSRITFIP